VTALLKRLAAASLGVLLAAQLGLSIVIAGRTAGADFGKLYYGWHLRDPYARTPTSLDVWPGRPNSWYRNLNPPHVSLIVWPFVSLPVRVAWVCWLLLQLASIAAIVRFTVRRGSGSGLPATP
jgi:hypothetical protein